MKLCRNVSLIEGLNNGRFPYCNVLKVGNILIDAGAGIKVLKELSQKIDVLLLSHTHPDHISGAWLFKRILAPKGFKTDIDSLALRFVGERLAEIWKSFAAKIGLRSFTCEGYEEGVILDNPEIYAIAVLGHSADHYVFLIDQKILFGSDIDLTTFGPFYGNPESDPYLFRREIEKLFKFDFDVFVPAHSKPVFGREEALEKIRKFIEKFDEREWKILELLEEPKTIDEIVEASPIYGKKPYAKDMLDFFERNMILKHIDKLLRKGKIKKEGNYYIKT